MRYCFEDYSLDVGGRELKRGNKLISLEPLVFDVLEFLVRNHQSIISKDDLIVGVWNRRFVSDSTVSSRIAAVRQAIGDNGKEQRLLRTISRRGFRFVGLIHEERGEGRNLSPVSIESTAPFERRSDEMRFRPCPRPTIAVLPFLIISQEPGQESFVGGLTEDITTALTQLPWLAVRRHTPVERGFGLRYVLEGSVRTWRHRKRVTVKLIDAATGTHIWANRFDVRDSHILDLQDQISRSVVGAIGSKLEQIEINWAKRLPPQSCDASHCYLRGLGSVYQWSREGLSDALGQFHRAAEIEPEFALAYAMAAYCYVQRKSYGWITDWPREAAECARLARRAAELGRDDAVALSRAAHAIASVCHDVDGGAVFIDHAIRLNPNLAAAWYVSGWIRLFLGEQQLAIEHLTRAINLGPFDPLIFKMQAALAYAFFFSGRYDEATMMAGNAFCMRPGYLTALRGAAASHALAGRVDRAHELVADIQKLDPTLCLSNLSRLIPFQRPRDFGRWADALHRAGLPD